MKTHVVLYLFVGSIIFQLLLTPFISGCSVQAACGNALEPQCSLVRDTDFTRTLDPRLPISWLSLVQVQAKLHASRSKYNKLPAGERLVHSQNISAGLTNLVVLFNECERKFVDCKDSETRIWNRSTTCRKASDLCEELLCTSWMEARCTRGGPLCMEVNAMCAMQEFHHNHKHTGHNGLQVSINGSFLAQSRRDDSVIFLHIPKNAGTAIEDSGWAAGIRWGKHWAWGSVQMPDGYWCNKYHVPPAYLPDPELYMNTSVFCVSRHPFDRMVSEYKYLATVPWGQGPPWGEGPLSGLDGNSLCTPESLNEFVLEKMRSVLEGNYFQNDCHFVPQSDYIWGLGAQWCQKILKVTELPGAFDAYMSSKGLSARLTEKENVAVACPHLSQDDLSPEAKSLLLRVYSQDFKLLGYSPS